VKRIYHVIAGDARTRARIAGDDETNFVFSFLAEGRAGKGLILASSSTGRTPHC
jgi:hypothetical protein